MFALTGIAQAQVLYGVTSSALVTIDTTTSSLTTTVGQTNLTRLIPGVGAPFSLAYNTADQTLYALAYATNLTQQYLVSFDRNTGTATLAAALGNPNVVGYYKALEYVDSLSSLIVSRSSSGGSFVTDQLLRISPAGITALQASTGLDNDSSV